MPMASIKRGTIFIIWPVAAFAITLLRLAFGLLANVKEAVSKNGKIILIILCVLLKCFVYCDSAIQVAVYKAVDERLVACSKTGRFCLHAFDVGILHSDSDVVGRSTNFCFDCFKFFFGYGPSVTTLNGIHEKTFFFVHRIKF